jgi:hypothetical protein
MTVTIENLGAGPGGGTPGPPIPPGTQTLAFGAFAGDTPQPLNRGFTSLYFQSQSPSAGWNVIGGNPEFPHFGWQFRQLTPLSCWMMINAFSLYWMNALRLTQFAQVGIWWIPDDGGFFGPMLVSTATVGNVASFSGAYALIVESIGVNQARMSINLLQFGEASFSGVNPPMRTELLDCGIVNTVQFNQDTETRGGCLVYFQATDRVDRWELGAWVTQNYYPAFEGSYVYWENRGTVFDDTLDRGMPGYIVGNDPPTADAIQISDNWMGVQNNPWGSDWFLPVTAGLPFEPIRTSDKGVFQPPPDFSRKLHYEPVPGTFFHGKLIT